MKGTSFPASGKGISARRRQKGFKLVELVVVLAIASTVGVSAVSASYDSSADSGQGPRANAQLALAEAAARQEQYFLHNKRYTAHLDAQGLGLEDTTTPGGHYALRVDMPADACPTGYCYILSAVPRGAQAEDECGTLSLTSDGEKLPAGCW
jgi:type IV pilus assembly protein PilE